MGRWRAAFCGLLSLLLPGVGQIHANAWRAGLWFASITLAFEAAARLITGLLAPSPSSLIALSVLITLSAFIRLYGVVDAVRRARRSARLGQRRWFRSTWFAVVCIVLAGVGLDTSIVIQWQAFNIPSASGTPTLQIGDYILVKKRTAGELPARGDVVVFRYPRDQRIDYVKRVVGLPGDRIQLVKGELLINGQWAHRTEDGRMVVDEHGNHTEVSLYRETLPGGSTYSTAQMQPSYGLGNTREYKVPEGSIFTLGDYRDNSDDSRMPDVGYVPIDLIVGTAGVIYWSRDHSRIGKTVE